MKRRNSVAALLLFNLPWIASWFTLSRPSIDRGLSVPALYLVLVLSVVGLMILPLVLVTSLRRRWLLIIILGLVNVFWGLRWIYAFAVTDPYDASYAATRLDILCMMVISSVVVLLVYGIADRLPSR